MAVNVLINGETHDVYRGVKLPLADGSGHAVYNYAYNIPNVVELLEALVGTGTQWIDTELIMTYPASGYEMKLVFELTDMSKTRILMGESSTGDNQIAVFDSGKVSYSRASFSGVTAGTKYTYTERNGAASLNDKSSTVKTSLIGIAPGYSTALFGQKLTHTSVEAATIAKMKLYEFSYSEGGEEKIHLLPALDAAGVAGLYDTVSGRMFYSQTDAFEYEEKTE